jgi:hypothetical protein
MHGCVPARLQSLLSAHNTSPQIQGIVGQKVLVFDSVEFVWRDGLVTEYDAASQFHKVVRELRLFCTKIFVMQFFKICLHVVKSICFNHAAVSFTTIVKFGVTQIVDDGLDPNEHKVTYRGADKKGETIVPRIWFYRSHLQVTSYPYSKSVSMM